MSGRVEMDVVLPHPPERVWRALTDSATLAEWLMPNDFRPRIGYRFGFARGRGLSRIACQVVEMEPERRLAFTWRERPDDLPDLVTWTVEPVEGGTRLRVEHVQASPEPVLASAAALAPLVTSVLWCGAAIRLEALLAGRLVMGRVVPVSGGAPVNAVSIRRVDSIVRGRVRC
jgi:uncharacterized protein YndB with AHSA1/START domain